MRLFRPWSLIQCLYPEALFRIKTNEKQLFLTFDDSPDPASTLHILEILRRNNISALFFCTGLKAEKYPELIEKIRSAGHLTGNHGYSHLDGWKTNRRSYLPDIARADNITSAEIFRPPYGRLTPAQYNSLKKKYKIFFWDLMPYDFDTSFGEENVLKVLKEKIRPGSIIVLHDSPMSYAAEILEEFLAHTGSEGYKFADPKLIGTMFKFSE